MSVDSNSSTSSFSSLQTDSFNFCNSSLVRQAKLELEGDLGLLGDLDIFEELGDLGSEFLGDLDDLDFDLEWPGNIQGICRL